MKWSDRIQILKKYSNTLILSVCFLMLLPSTLAMGSEDYELTWSSVTGGGGQSTNGSYVLMGAVGSFSTIISSFGSLTLTPDPMEWAAVPCATGPSSVSMTAVEANSPAGDIEYYFENITVVDGSHDSGWQSALTYVDDGLEPDTTYEYRVKAHDAVGRETDWSIVCLARTLPESGSIPEGAADPVSGELGSDLNLEVNPFTGSVTYNVPIVVPPGRQGSGPRISLNYGSGGGNGWCGVGWSVGMGTIQRDTRKGVPVARDEANFLSKYDDDKGFVSNFGSANSRLVEVDEQTHEYRVEVDQAFMKYEYDAGFGEGGLWTVTDKSGNKFYFGEVAGEFAGETAGAVMEHPQFDSSTSGDNVFLWALAKIQDINGNLTFIYYTIDGGQIYLDEIRYNGHVEPSPDGLPATSRVRFVLDPNDDPQHADYRQDKSVSYNTGYRVQHNRRLRNICVEVYDYTLEPQPDWVSVRRYELDYDQSPSTLRSLLNSVTMYGADDTTSLPPVTFAYTEKPFEFERDEYGEPILTDWSPLDSQEEDADWNSPVATDVQSWLHNYIYEGPLTGVSFYADVPFSHNNTYVSIADLNGDALPDRVMRNNSGFTSPDNNFFKVQFNTGSSFHPFSDWGPLDSQGHEIGVESKFWNSPRATWSDIYECSWSTYQQYEYNAYTDEWEWVEYANFDCSFADDVSVDILDINGDGYADRVMRKSGLTYQLNSDAFKVQFNDGTGLSSIYNWGPLYSCGFYYDSTQDPFGVGHSGQARLYNSIRGNYSGEFGSPTYVDLLDMNGDGLPDRILCDDRHVSWDHFEVQFNSGEGFEQVDGDPVVTEWGPVDGQNSNNYMWISIRSTDLGEETVTDIFDINGDGLPDRVMRKRSTPYDMFKVQFNTGYGFECNSNGTAILRDWGPLNSQGETQRAWNSIQAFKQLGNTFYIDMFDINGDGLADRVMRKKDDPYGVFKVQLNTGSGFQANSQGQGVIVDWEGVDDQGTGETGWASPHCIHKGQTFDNTYATMCDINGDGLLDRVMREVDSPYEVFKVQLNKGPLPDMLSNVTGKLGGSVEVTYDRSNSPENYDRHKDHSGVNRLPVPIYVADSVTIKDGMGTESTTTYDYSRGFWDTSRREFGGFGRVEITDPHGAYTVNYYHQGGGYDDPNNGETDDVGQFPKRGIAYRTEVWGNDDLLYNITLNKVEVAEVQANSGWYFPYVEQTITMDYEGALDDSGVFRAKAGENEYDLTTGNLIRQSSWGEVTGIDVPNHTFTTNIDAQDDLHTHTIYKVFTGNADILNKPEETIVTDSEILNDPSAQKLRGTLFFYDEDTPGYCLYTGTRGNLTQQSVWLDQEAGQVADRYISSHTYYDVYGNGKATIDPADIVTVVQYDTDYQMFGERILTGKGEINPATFDFVDEEGKFITEAAFDPRSGTVIASVDLMGIVTETLYDEFFRPNDIYRSTEPLGEPALWQTTVEYNLGGITGGGTSSDNYIHQRHNGYDAYIYNDGLGRVIQVRTRAEIGAGAEYRANHTRYDQAGKIEFASLLYFDNGSSYHINESALGSTSEYDPIGRIWRITPSPGEPDSPTGPTVTEYKDGTDVWASIVTDAEGNVTRQYFDAQNRAIELVEVLTDPEDPTTEIQTFFGYDRLGRMNQIEDNEGNTILQYFDSLDRRVAIDDPDMGHWEYEYDDAGNLVRQIDAKNNRTEMVYNEDEIGRITSKEVYSDSNDLAYAATYTYDESDDPNYTVYKGLLYEIVDKEGTVQNGYDTRGRLSKSTRSLTINSTQYTTQTAYDDADRVSVLTYPNNAAQICYEYDSVGHLIEARALSGTGIPNQVLYQATSFNESDQLEGADYGNGVKTRYLYYANSKRRERILTDYEGNPANPDPNDDLQNLRYTYDMASNIRSITDGSPFAGQGEADSTFSNILYDGLYRLRFLTYAAQAPVATGFEYDALGNIIYNGETGGSNYTYDPNKVHAVIGALGKTYEYDACGNMTHRDSALQNMFYDEENQLVQYDVDVSNSITFGYDVDGERLWKRKNDTITGIWIGSLWEYKDEDADGTGVNLCHVTVDDGLVCTFEPEPGPDSVFYYYHSDHLGSSSVITDPNGDICKHYGYRAFGDGRWDDSDYDDNMDVTNRYTGQMLDKDTGLYYYGARYYDPELARFTQPDPVIPDNITANSQALNRYTYSFNNPLIFTDPTGNTPLAILAPTLAPILTAPLSSLMSSFTAQTSDSTSYASASTSGNGASALSDSQNASAPSTTIGIMDWRNSNSSLYNNILADDPYGMSSLLKRGNYEREQRWIRSKTDLYSGVGTTSGKLYSGLHIGMDVGGSFPGIGEPIDFIHGVSLTSEAALGTRKGAGWESLLTFVSMAPVVGDTFGKGGKYATKYSDELIGIVHQVNKHHPWPKYLGGPTKQALDELPVKLHKSYHKGLDKLLPRVKSSQYYKNLSATEQAQNFEILRKYTQNFDSKYGTQLWDSIKRTASALDQQ